MDPLRIGVLGTARIATTALLEPAARVPEVTVAAVGARNASRATAYAEQHDIPVAYGSYHALLADPDIDAVYIPLPNSLHGPWTLMAIAAGNAAPGAISGRAKSRPSTPSAAKARRTRSAAAPYSATGSAGAGWACQTDGSAPFPAAAAAKPSCCTVM